MNARHNVSKSFRFMLALVLLISLYKKQSAYARKPRNVVQKEDGGAPSVTRQRSRTELLPWATTRVAVERALQLTAYTDVDSTRPTGGVGTALLARRPFLGLPRQPPSHCVLLAARR